MFLVIEKPLKHCESLIHLDYISSPLPEMFLVIENPLKHCESLIHLDYISSPLSFNYTIEMNLSAIEM